MGKSRARTRGIRKHVSGKRHLAFESLEARELLTASPIMDPTEPESQDVYSTLATVQPTAVVPTVTLGTAVSMAEGFGYGTTLVGHGKAIDTTVAGTFPFGILGNSLGIAESGKFTMEGWFYPKPGLPNGVIWSFSNVYQLQRSGDIGLRMILGRSGSAAAGTQFDVTVNDVLNADAWNHVAMTFDGDTLRLFVNGVAVADVPDAAPEYADTFLVEPSVVSFYNTAGSPIGAGAIDDIQVWNVARSQAEIQAGMLNPRTGNEPGLVAYWNFDNPGNNEELDSSPTGNTLSIANSLRFESVAPQIGYVDVILDRPVESVQDLWVTYSITGGTATVGSDFLGSSFRKVSNDPNSERFGIIIPQGESTARIYFMARSDAVAEPNETINIALSSYSFTGGQDYIIGAASTASLTIRDSGAYRQGVAIFDSSGRPVIAGSPLFVDPDTRSATFTVKLTSEPDFPTVNPEQVSIVIQSGPNAQVDNAGAVESIVLTFTPANWDTPRTVTLRNVTQDGTFTVTGSGFPGTSYLATPASFAFTLTPPNRADVEEGNAQDAAGLTPTVNVTLTRNVVENSNQPALITFALNTAAPVGGLDVFYTVLAPTTGSAATSGVDFQPLSGIVHIEDGALTAQVPIFSINDSISEADAESLVVRLSASASYQIGSQSQATVLVVDDDQAGISVVNPTFLDVATAKSLVRPDAQYLEFQNPYGYGEGNKIVIPLGGNYESPRWSAFGGIAAAFSGQADRDILEFIIPANIDPTAKITIKFTPTGVNGQPIVPTFINDFNEVDSVSFRELFQLESLTGTRLQGGGLATPRLATIVSDDTIEFSLAGLAGGTYQLVLQATSSLGGILANFGTTGVSYDYEAVLTSNPVAPYQLATSTTVTTYSSTYAPLSTIESVVIPPITEPNNSLNTAYALGTVTDGVTVRSQVIDSNADVDYFRFKLDQNAGRPDTLALLFTQANGDATHNLRLEILSTTGTLLQTLDTATENEYASLVNLADGEYIARITASTTAVVATNYVLKFRSLASTTEPENNETLATATYMGIIGNGDRFNDFTIRSAGDADYYRFTINRDSFAVSSLNLVSTYADGNLGMTLYNATTGSVLSTQATANNIETISLATIPDGDYVLRVSAQDNDARNKYDLVFGPVTSRANQIDPNQVALRLDTKPTANVTLTLANGNPGEGQLSTTTLLFTPENWNQYQLVRVTPVDDAYADGDTTYTVTATASSTDPFYQNKILRFNIVNVDRGDFVAPDVVNSDAEPNAPIVTLTAIASGPRAEGQQFDAFRVSLATPLSYALTVGIDFQRGTGNFNQDFIIYTGTDSYSEVVIPAGATSYIVRAALLTDGVDESTTNVNETIVATLIDQSGYRPSTVSYTAKIDILDVDVAGLTVTSPQGNAQLSVAATTEDQSVPGIAHTVVLKTKPAADVTVYVASTDPGQGVIQIDPTKAGSEVVKFIFTPDNWNIARTFYVKGVDNAINEARAVAGGQAVNNFQFVISAQSDDEVYRSLAPLVFNATNLDNDNLGITVSSPQATVDGRANVFSVVLNSRPLGEVRVTATPQNDQFSMNGAREGDPVTLVFNASNWNIPQLVQVVAFDDGIVEYLHKSQINFSVEVGRRFDGLTTADLRLPENAYELGDIAGGVRWTNLTLPTATDNTAIVADQWFEIELESPGSALQQIRVVAAGSNRSDIPELLLYDASGATLLRTGVYTGPVFNGSTVTQTAVRTLTLNNLAAGKYLIRLADNPVTTASTLFDLLIDDADRAFESVPLAPVQVSIKDNDVPIADVVAGPTASELFSNPSYFTVRLNAPAPAEAGDTGIKVNFRITGGRATFGTSSTLLHDYSVIADEFDVTSGTGSIRIAPGDNQANIGIIPVDDKLVEDLPVFVRQLTGNATSGYSIRIAALPEIVDPTGTQPPNYLLSAGSIVKAQIAPGKEVTLRVKADTLLVRAVYGTTTGGIRVEYAAGVAVEIDAEDAAVFATAGSNDISAKVESEDIEITLLNGIGYTLPLAPDKQGADPGNAANLDKTRMQARMIVYDDDVAGVQIIEVGEHTTLEEGTEATYQILLTGEPLAPVTITVTPGLGLEIVDPTSTTSVNIEQITYRLDRGSLQNEIDLNFISLSETDQGYTAVFDVRLAAVTLGSAARVSTLLMQGANGGGSTAATFEIPGASDVDFAGNPVEGTWNTIQRIVVSNLKINLDGSFTLNVNLDGVVRTIQLTASKAQVARASSVVTFNSSNWFVPQTITIRASENGYSEPGAWHKDFLSYKVTSTDGNWNGLSVPAQEVHIVDRRLDVGETIEGFGAGLTLLEDSLDNLSLPLIGSIGSLLDLGANALGLQSTTFAAVTATGPDAGPTGFFEEFNRPLKKAFASQDQLTVGKFQAIAQSALQPLVASGVFDRVQVRSTTNDNDINFVLSLDKLVRIGQFSLSSDLGLDALGLSFTTTGKAKIDLAVSIDIGVGWNKQFGFYIDTGATGVQMGARLYLEGNGATTQNPNNLFTGQGSIGPLQVDFTDDTQNRTELAVTFEISLNDLDNVNTVRFFDVNGDGLLAEKPFTYNVAVDANSDGRIDKDQNGNPVSSFRTISEAWANISPDGVADPFPTVTSLVGNTSIGGAVLANWNTVGANRTIFNESISIEKEGIYRLKTVNDQTIVYFDLNRDGDLDIARRKADPMTLSWSSLTEAEKNSSEIWFSVPNPRNFKELKIVTTGSGASLKYYVDLNDNKAGEAGEQISATLAKKIDRNGNKIVEADVIQDGEGQYRQGTSLAYYDTNSDGKLDFNEAFVNFGFGPFQLQRSALIKDSAGNYIVDFNRDGSFNSGQITTAAEFKLRTDGPSGFVYLDIDGDSVRDPNEPQAAGSAELIFVEQSAVDAAGMTVSFDGNRYNVLTINGQRFIDLDRNGALTLDSKGRALEPVATQLTKIGVTEIGRLVVAIEAKDPSAVVDIAPIVQKLKTPDTQLTVSERQTLINYFASLVAAGKIIQQVGDGNRLTLSELKTFLAANKQANTTKTDQLKGVASQLFTYTFQGDINLGLKTRTSIDGSRVLPAIQFDLAVNIPLFNLSNAKQANSKGVTVEFKNVAIDLGTFLANYVTPILKTTNDIIAPIKPIIQALNADTKLLGKIGLASQFESDGKPGISLLEIAKVLAGDNTSQVSKIEKAIRFADQLSKLVNVIDVLTGSLSTDPTLIALGDFSLDDFRAASDDLANAASRSRNTPRTDGAPTTTARLPNTPPGNANSQAQSSSLRDKYNALKQLEGFDIKLFNPNTVLALITGESNVNLITYDIPDFDFSFAINKPFSIWGPIAGKLEGGFTVATDLSMGFDTHGIEAWAKQNYAPDKSYLVFDGLFLDDWNPSGTDKDELTVRAFVAAGLGLDVLIASGFLKGGIEGQIGFDFVDVGERAGTSDGKIRGSDIIEKFSTNPAELFDLHGSVLAFLGAEINVNLLFFKATVYESRLASFELAKFKLDASGFKGSALGGKVQSGPVDGATIWFDANNNFLLDEDEPWTTTDAEGDYNLVIPDGYDISQGEIRVSGGTDISTGLQTTADFAIPNGVQGNATAFTSLASQLELVPVDTLRADLNGDLLVTSADKDLYWELLLNDPENPLLDADQSGVVDEADVVELSRLFNIAASDGTMSVEQSFELIKSVFGIDPDVDLSTFAHFEEARAGNPLAAAVILGINNLNTVVTQIQSLLAGIAGLSSSDRLANAYLSDAIFFAIAQEMVDGRLDLGDTAQLRRIILEAGLSASAWLSDLQIPLNLTRLETLVDGASIVISASVINQRQLATTTSDPVELARLITQAKVIENGKAAVNLYQAAAGTRTFEEVIEEDGQTGEAALTAIRSVSLPPLVSNVNDVFMNEDQIVLGLPVVIRSQSGQGPLTVSLRASNQALLPDGSFTVTPDSISGQYLISIAPAPNRFGTTMVTLRVSEADGTFVERQFKVTVSAVNDLPIANPDSALVIAGKSVAIDLLGNDSDVDGDSLRVSGVTAPAGGIVSITGQRNLTYAPAVSTRGLEVLNYQIFDGNGGTAGGTVTMQVLAPLTVDAALVQVPEADKAVNAGTYANVAGVSVSLSASVGQIVKGANGQWNWSWDTADGPIDSQTVTITAVYGGTTVDTITFELKVENVTPTLQLLVSNAPLLDSTSAGRVVTVYGAFSDPSRRDTHTAVIEWGDGLSSVATVDQFGRVLFGQHAYTRSGVYEVKVSLTDSDRTTTYGSTLAVVGGFAAVHEGILYVVGTADNDAVVLGQKRDQVEITANFLPGIRHSVSFHERDFGSIVVILGDGNDRLVLADSVLSPASVLGGDGDDWLQAGSQSVLIDGGVGNDWIGGSRSHDVILGGEGNDVIFAGLGDDLVDGGAGEDYADGGVGNDQLFGDAGNDLLVGGFGEDLLSGGIGNDSLHGGFGADLLFGNEGNDLLLGGPQDDVLVGDLGDDILFGGEGRDVRSGGPGYDLLDGLEVDDKVLASILVDRLFSRQSSDAGSSTASNRASKTGVGAPPSSGANESSDSRVQQRRRRIGSSVTAVEADPFFEGLGSEGADSWWL